MIKDSSDLITYSDKGLYCKLADTWIDPHKPVNRALITHAHMDHFTFGCNEYISTYETSVIRKEFKINGINISFHPSGHILGACQIRFNFAGERWLITGDFKRQKDETCQEFEKVKTDYLISESTFGLPIFKWEEPQKTAFDISKWVESSPDKTSILFCYSLGKAQRLLNEINKTNFKNNIYIHNSIYRINNSYKKLGINILDTYKFDKTKDIDEYKGNLILLPPILNKESFCKKFQKIQTGFASGWMSIRALRKRSGYDKGFAISDHADWEAILKTVKESEAKNILFHHGDSEALNRYLNETNSINVINFEF